MKYYTQPTTEIINVMFQSQIMAVSKSGVIDYEVNGGEEGVDDEV